MYFDLGVTPHEFLEMQELPQPSIKEMIEATMPTNSGRVADCFSKIFRVSAVKRSKR